MPEAPTFFLPTVKPEKQEAMYAELARICQSAMPIWTKRIYSLRFLHNGEEWTATVGRSLAGVRYRSVRRRGQRVDLRDSLSDPATVLAIFEGSPYMVATDHGLLRNVGSEWASPFMAGQPEGITYFSPSPSPVGARPPRRQKK